MKKRVLMEKCSDGTFGATTMDTSHVIWGQNDTVAGAKDDLKLGLEDMIASYTEFQGTVPEELCDFAFDYQYDVRSIFIPFDFIDISKFAAWAGIEVALYRFDEEDATTEYYLVSETQTAQLVESLHRLGEKLSAVSLTT